MKEYFDKIMTWIKENVWLSVGILAAVLLLFFPKLLKTSRRRRTRRRISTPIRRRRTRRVSAVVKRRAKRIYNRGGAKKKPWQIKGSMAARRHMAQIRKRR